MQRFKNILAHVNLTLDEHPALTRGVRLARQNSAKLTAMTVMEEHPALARSVLRSLHLENALATIEREHREKLEQLVQPIRDAGLDVETIVAQGSTFVEVIRTACERHHDLVIKTVSSEGIFHRAFFGSVDMHLLRKCPTPLWLIKPGEPKAFGRILVPLDPNMENGIKHDLGMNLLKLGTSLAEMEHAELLIVYAWRAYEEEKLKKYMEPEQFEEYVRTWGKESSNRAWRFVSAFGREIPSNSIHLVQGDPGFVIPKFARDHNVDLVVMGTLGRLGQHGMFIGDIAEDTGRSAASRRSARGFSSRRKTLELKRRIRDTYGTNHHCFDLCRGAGARIVVVAGAETAEPLLIVTCNIPSQRKP